MPTCHVKFFPSQIHFAHLDIVWVVFVMWLCILLNCIGTNLLVLLAYSDIAAAATTTITNQTKKKQTNHTETWKCRKLDNCAT
jgi:hypothetical protein